MTISLFTTISLFIILLYVSYRLIELQRCFEELYEDIWKTNARVNGLEFDVTSRNANYIMRENAAELE